MHLCHVCAWPGQIRLSDSAETRVADCSELLGVDAGKNARSSADPVQSSQKEVTPFMALSTELINGPECQ